MSLHAGLSSPRPLVREAPVAIVCNGSTLGVMMASPDNLEDFAIGFALTEGLVPAAAQVEDLEVLEHDAGWELRFWVTGPAAKALSERQRAMIGPVGCGLCGIDSLANATRALPPLPDGSWRLTHAEACSATQHLRAHQPEHDRTRACHAAGFMLPGQGIVLAREDVGRHNALDKLAGAMAREGVPPSSGALVLTSRVSTDMVQKTVTLGAPILIAVSAATDYAVRLAEAANLTLVTRAKGRHCEVHTGAHRISNSERGRYH
ncbi:formate dehydrogenase accessory sulfurtransferase FdhD [Sulfitobacter sp. PS-8MA]|uniref:formate dehydrogenase accessory sulfurtransferase FdhD n=1 Tax=Sulfitobacter sp. PS-8MA TaxID=3237707 RepID=UPI0034C65B5C